MNKTLNTGSQVLSVISSLATLYTVYRGSVITVPGNQSMFDFIPAGTKIPLAIVFGILAVYFYYKSKNK